MTAWPDVAWTATSLALASLLLAAFAGCRNAADAPDAGVAVYVGDEMVRGYDPEPMLAVEATEVPAAKFTAIDIHCHWSLEQDPQAILDAMDRRNIRAAVNLSGGSGERLDRMLARFHDAAPERLLVFCNLDYTGIDEPGWSERTVEYLREARRRGVAGLKVYKDLGLRVRDASGKLVPIDDPRLDPVWAACGELGMPVLIHTADPAAFFQPLDRDNERWMQLRRHPSWSFHGEAYPSRAELFAQRNRVLDRHRGTTFIGAHMGSHAGDLDTLARTLDEHPNLVVDISGRVNELGRQPYTARRFFIDYQDRILFGTDRFPGRERQPRYTIYYRFFETDDEYFKYYDHPFPPAGEWRIDGIDLPDHVLEKVYYRNAERVLFGGADDRAEK